MASILYTTVPTKRLAASITAASSTIQLNNILGWDGAALSASDFGTKLYCVFRNDANTAMEIMELDPSTIASASITILRRGLKFTGDLTTEVTGNKLTWVKNETLVELGTDVPQLLNHTVRTVEDQSIDGVKTFSSFPAKSGTTTPSSASEFATKAYVDGVVGGSAVYDQNLIPGTAGETLAAGNLTYFKESDQRWWLIDADAFATSGASLRLAFAQGTTAAGASVNLLLAGLEKNLTGLTAGAKYFLSNTAGGISTTPGTLQRFVGWALSTTRFIFAPEGLPENLILDTAGETLVVGDIIYFKESDQKWWKTDADAAATSVAVRTGVCELAAAADAITIIRTGGIDKTHTGLTGGSRYYISGTAGALATTPGTFQRFYGFALSTTEISMATSSDPTTRTQSGQEVYAADAVGTDTYAITLAPAPAAYYIGMEINFKAGTANTGACSLNVNGLGAKTIKKAYNSDLATGDILQNQIVKVIYDGTNLQMQSPSSVTGPAGTYANGFAQKNIADASTTQTIAHGLGVIPRSIQLFIVSATTGNNTPAGFLMVAYNGTTTSVAGAMYESADAFNQENSFNVGGASGSTGYQAGVVTFDATNISIAWTKNSTPTGTASIMWQAVA